MIEILNYRHWAIESSYFSRVSPLVLSAIENGGSIDKLIKKYKIEDLPETRYQMKVSYDRDSGLLVATSAAKNNVAIIPVLGALTKRGDLCSYGMRDYAAMIERANAAENIAAIVIDAETPGGTVDGTPEMGLAIKNSTKPVIVFGDNMVASAGMWLASQASEIFANVNNPTEFGSIGVLCMHENYQAYIAKNIGSVEILRAPQSVDKARVNVIEPLTDDQRAEIVEEMRPIAADFISVVKAGRKGKLNAGDENLFTGKMYGAADALKYGLIDAIDTFQAAIDRAAVLAQSNNSGLSKSNNKSKKESMKFPKLSALFGGTEKEANEDGLSPEEESASMEAAEKKLADMENANGTLAAKVAELEKSIADKEAAHQAAIEAKDNEVAELQAKLDKKPAAAATTATTEAGEDKHENADTTNKYETSADRELAQVKAKMKPVK